MSVNVCGYVSASIPTHVRGLVYTYLCVSLCAHVRVPQLRRLAGTVTQVRSWAPSV